MILNLIEKRFWTQEGFLPKGIATKLYEQALIIDDKNLMKDAKVGKGAFQRKDVEVRSDNIFWVDNYDTETGSMIKTLFEGLLLISKRELFLPSKRFESHFAKYEKGSFYLRHRDRHYSHPNRLLTCVVYLSDMSEADGGELVVYQEDHQAIRVRPQTGRIVVFDSELEHEVRVCSKDRWSLTGWIRSDLHPGIIL